LRFTFTALFVAALIAVPLRSNAAPRTIDDCEKIQAADAYNQCLALFGPVARGHSTTGGGHMQDAELTAKGAHADAAAAEDARHRHRHASRHGWSSHRWARHGHWHRTKAASHRHGHRKSTDMAFSVVTGRTRLR
jgi:hypothetical protein